MTCSNKFPVLLLWRPEALLARSSTAWCAGLKQLPGLEKLWTTIFWGPAVLWLSKLKSPTLTLIQLACMVRPSAECRKNALRFQSLLYDWSRQFISCKISNVFWVSKYWFHFQKNAGMWKAWVLVRVRLSRMWTVHAINFLLTSFQPYSLQPGLNVRGCLLKNTWQD